MKIVVKTPIYERRDALGEAREKLRAMLLHRDFREPKFSNTKHLNNVFGEVRVTIEQMRLLDYGFWEQIPVPVIKGGRKDVTPFEGMQSSGRPGVYDTWIFDNAIPDDAWNKDNQTLEDFIRKGPHRTGDPDFDARINFVHHQTHEQREDLYRSDAWRQYKEKMKWANFGRHYGMSAEEMANEGEPNMSAAREQFKETMRKVEEMLETLKAARDADVYPDDWDTDYSDEPDNWYQFRNPKPTQTPRDIRDTKQWQQYVVYRRAVALRNTTRQDQPPLVKELLRNYRNQHGLPDLDGDG